MGGKGETKDGVLASFTTYESSDGTRIFTRTEFFTSVVRMKTQFRAKAGRFTEILERTDVKDRQGNITGARIVGKHPSDEAQTVEYAIMWSRGNEIRYIESVSLDLILDFEKTRNKPPN
jgi:hypothetical protein